MKELTERYNDSDNYPVVEVLYDNRVIFSWSDNANLEYPEDLNWNRMISEVFYSGVKAGKLIKEDRKLHPISET